MAHVEVEPDPEQRVSVLATRFVLSYLAGRADGDGNAWPAVNSIAAHTGLPRRSVQYALRVLIEQGVITVVRPAGGRGRPATYRVALPPESGASTCAPSEDERGGSTCTPSPESGASTCAPSEDERVHAPTGKGASPNTNGRMRMHTNTNTATNVVSRGGGRGAASADAEAAAHLLAERLADRGEEVNQREIAEAITAARLTEGWPAEVLVADVLTRWPKVIYYNATSTAVAHLKKMPATPSLTQLTDWVAEMTTPALAELDECEHDPPHRAVFERAIDALHHPGHEPHLDVYLDPDVDQVKVEGLVDAAQAAAVIDAARAHASACLHTPAHAGHDEGARVA